MASLRGQAEDLFNIDVISAGDKRLIQAHLLAAADYIDDLFHQLREARSK